MSHETTTTDQNRPPRDTATDVEDGVQSDATGSKSLWAGYADDEGARKDPQGTVWVEFEYVGAGPCYMRLTRSATSGTTSANGAVLVAGTPRRFYVDPRKDLFIDWTDAAAGGTVKWRRVGAICERSRQ